MKKFAILMTLVAAGAIYSEISSTRMFNAFIKENGLTDKYAQWSPGYIQRKSEEWDIRNNRW